MDIISVITTRNPFMYINIGFTILPVLFFIGQGDHESNPSAVPDYAAPEPTVRRVYHFARHFPQGRSAVHGGSTVGG